MNRPMSDKQIVMQQSLMNICYQRIVTALMDLDVLLGEAEDRCCDTKALERMREVHRRANRLARPTGTSAASPVEDRSGGTG